MLEVSCRRHLRQMPRARARQADKGWIITGDRRPLPPRDAAQQQPQLLGEGHDV